MGQEHLLGSAHTVEPGTHRVFEIEGRQFGIFNVDGEFYALPNICFHQNGPLCRGIVSGTVEADEASGWQPAWRLDGEVVICPWHSLEFHVKTGRCLALPGRSLPTYAVREIDGKLYITL